ncbi:MAG: type II toxin-antitoxin system VapC family toxin [Abitibacteriaceae bacterium]|nr:type II toxin-antitoxin system VapC family toxin [Abditibacteriaceae bacterium]
MLNISSDHLVTVATLPLHHRDPFDRLLIAQAIVERMPMVSVDTVFDAYGIQRLW